MRRSGGVVPRGTRRGRLVRAGRSRAADGGGRSCCLVPLALLDAGRVERQRLSGAPGVPPTEAGEGLTLPPAWDNTSAGAAPRRWRHPEVLQSRSSTGAGVCDEPAAKTECAPSLSSSAATHTWRLRVEDLRKCPLGRARLLPLLLRRRPWGRRRLDRMEGDQ